MLNIPIARLCPRYSPSVSLTAWLHEFPSKEVKKKTYTGRLEYLNRGDPFDQNKTSTKIKDKPKTRTHLPNHVRAYLWGNGELGALGQPGFLHPKGNRRILKKMRKPFISSLGNYYKIRSAACGYGYTLFVTDDKEKQLFGTGLNDSGQIGHHRRLNKEGKQAGKPLEVVIAPAHIVLPLIGDEKVLSVAAGRAHSLVLTNRGRVLTMGNNGYGQCGRPIVEGEDYMRNQDAYELNLERVSKIVCGQDHSLLLTEDGELWSCGWGADGQTGLGHYYNSGQLSKVGGDLANEKVVKVVCAADCVLALSEKGDVFGWGNSEYGQFSLLTDEQQISIPRQLPFKGLGNIVDVASGGTVCMLLNEEGKVFVWGYGILGKGPNLDSASEPTEIPQVLFGKNSFSPQSRVTSIYCGLGHQAAVTDNGDLYMWGRNRGGCLGLMTDEDRYFPLKVSLGGKVKHVSLGVDHTVAIATRWSG